MTLSHLTAPMPCKLKLHKNLKTWPTQNKPVAIVFVITVHHYMESILAK